MELFEAVIGSAETVKDAIWTYGPEIGGVEIPLLVVVLLAAGLFFTAYQLFPQIKFFRHALDIVFGKHDDPSEEGEISHFQALCAALSATLGLGNIMGVAVAITLGGPGALFWMWVAGFFGMATKLTSISLALMYRHKDSESGAMHGGPMFTIRNALPKRYLPLAYMFSGCVILGAIGGGNMLQANQMALMLETSMSIPNWVTGLVFMGLAGLVLVGGIQRIGNVAGKLVPSMVVLYVLACLGLIAANADMLPAVFAQIFTDAFTGEAAGGGLVGTIVIGIQRAVFSSEAGQGSAAMAHSAAKSHPIQEGLVGMLGPFIDTIVVCTVTGLAILVTGVWQNPGAEGAALTGEALATLYGTGGQYLLTLVVVMFAFSTIVSWSYYGEQGVDFIAGERFLPAYRYVFLAMIFAGTVLPVETVLAFTDIAVGLTVIPNLIANVLLSRKLKTELANYELELAEAEAERDRERVLRPEPTVLPSLVPVTVTTSGVGTISTVGTVSTTGAVSGYGVVSGYGAVSGLGVVSGFGEL